jgi:PadR family transcriptional regulator PadR
MSDRTGTEAGIQPVARMTVPMLAVLAVLMSGDDLYGLRIAEATAMRTGTIYPILARFERAGWITSKWEEKKGPGEKNDPGAKRKYYTLTPGGRQCAMKALKEREEALARANPSGSVLPRSVFGH